MGEEFGTGEKLLLVGNVQEYWDGYEEGGAGQGR